MFDVFYFDKKPNLFPHERKVESMEEAQQLSRTRMFWIVNYLCDYIDFDFLWEPKPWEADQRHVWPSQWQLDSGTWLVPKQQFVDTNYTDKPTVKRMPIRDAVLIDHGNYKLPFPVPGEVNIVKTVRYVESYQRTLIRIANSVDLEYVWVISSICSYSNFDFSWHPDPWQKELLHVFATEDLQMGDTFLMHVPSAREKLPKIEILDWYDLNYVDPTTSYEHAITRLEVPVNRHRDDTHVDAIKNHTFTWPYEIFTNYQEPIYIPVPCLWRQAYKQIYRLSKGGSSVMVPKEAQADIKTQLYDYPWISTSNSGWTTDPKLPVVFLSNGESCADDNWNRLIAMHTDAVRVDRVPGRVASQRACAEAAGGYDWYFVVPAKLRVDENFSFWQQPDRMQSPKHYIYHAENPVVGVTYGHMAVVLYNRKLVLETHGDELDFTLGQPHEVVPRVSGVTTHDSDKLTEWRTAFREVIKLKYYSINQPDIETDYRLNKWLSCSSRWTKRGAEDAVNFYTSVDGNYNKLMQTYEWQWLDRHYKELYE